MTVRKRLPHAPQPMHYWEGFEGLRLAGDSWGESGPLVVLLHGGGQTRHAWKGAGQMLADTGYRAGAVDARGHGDTDWDPDAHYDDDAMVEDLVCVLEALGEDAPILVGASMGGATSLIAIGEDRVAARALVLVDMAPKIEAEGSAKIIEFMERHQSGFDSLEEVAVAISLYQPHRTRPRRLVGLAKNVRIGEDGRYYWHWDPRFPSAERDMEYYPIRLEACARRLTLPTLLVRGGLSDVVSEEGARSFLEVCPHAEYVNVEGAAHMVAGDRNDIFARAVIEFLTRVVPPSQGP
jgi:pimeloyl-ACP methyl ester carboxylesterase